MNKDMEEEELWFTFGYLYLTLRSDQFPPLCTNRPIQGRHNSQLKLLAPLFWLSPAQRNLPANPVPLTRRTKLSDPFGRPALGGFYDLPPRL